MTENEFVGKWQLRFRNNDLFEIDEGDLREFAQDIAATFGADDPRAVFEHLFENQYGKHPEFNTQHEVNGFVLQLLTAKQVQAAPDAPEFSLFDDAANTVVLSHKAYSYVDLRYDLPGGAVGLPVPADGIIRPGNIAGQIAGYVRAAGGRLQSDKAYSPVFTSVTVAPPVKPSAPKLTNFDDVANTINVFHPNYSYLELRYNFNGQTGLLVSADGLISVGNVAAQVEVYVVADATQNRVQGLPAYSQPFTTGTVVVTPPVGTAPTVTGFGPVSAAVGAAVTITGTNFTGATAMLFNGTAAAFTVLNATTINATVPVGATTGPVSVATAAGTGTSTASFTVTVATTPVALAVSFTLPGGNTLTAGQSLSFSASASGGTAPYSHEVSATNSATGVVTGIGASVGAQYSGSWQSVPAGEYDLVDTVTDAAGTVKISTSRHVVASAVSTAPTAPAQVTGVTANAGTIDATLGWNTPASNGAAIASYRVEYRPLGASTFSVFGTTANNTITLTGLASDTPYEVRIAATNSVGTGPTSEPIAFRTLTAAPPSTTDTTLVVDATRLAYNGRSLANNGGTQYDPLSEFSILTNSSNLSVNAYGFNEAGGPIQAADVWVDNVWFGKLGTFADGKTGAQIYTLSGLPGSGPRVVRFTMAAAANYQSSKPFDSYVSLVSVVVPAGFSGQFVPVTKHLQEIIYVRGDSTTQDQGSQSWSRVLNRDYRPNSDIYVTGEAGGVIAKFISDDAQRQALLNDYKTYRVGYSRGIFWFDDMVNPAYFDSYTPAQLKSFYKAFAQLFLADSALSNDTLYFKSAVPRGYEGPNTLGFPLFAYRDAMSEAVAEINNVRVRYADGTQLQKAQYLTDGTHFDVAGHAYMAGEINKLLNQTVGTDSLTSVTAQQFGSSMILSTNSLQPVQYSMEEPAGSNTYTNWQSDNKFPTPTTAGARKFRARLQSNTSTVVTTTKVLNKVIFANSPELELVGTWQSSPDNVRQAFSTVDNSFWRVRAAFTRAIIYQNRQSNISEIEVQLDAQAAQIVNISGPGISYVEQRVYETPDLPNVYHSLSVGSGNGTTMNFYCVELIDYAPASPPASNPITTYFTAANSVVSGPVTFLGNGQGFDITDASTYVKIAFTATSSVSAVLGELGNPANGVALMSINKNDGSQFGIGYLSSTRDQAGGASGQNRELYRFPTVPEANYYIIVQKQTNDGKPVRYAGYVVGI